MAMAERQEQKAESGRLKWENIKVCHNVSLWETSAAAFGKETKYPTRIRGISRFTLQNSPSFSGFIQASKSRLIKVNQA